MTIPTLTTPVFDHLSVGVEDLDRAVAFYDASLAPLGLVRLWRNARAAGYGPEGFKGEAPFAVIRFGPEARHPAPGLHIAFMAKTREAVDGFHAAALEAGGVDEGPPGVRENYDPGYYAAFVRDPDGHRIEAVLHEQVVHPRAADPLPSREVHMTRSAIFEIDGANFEDLEGFWDEVSRQLIPGVTWGRNMDAFNDILRGGAGTPEGGFVLRWTSSERSRQTLGYEETARWLERKVERCHPANVSSARAELEAARAGRGPTLFDLLVEIIEAHGAGGDEAQDAVELRLE